MESFIFHLRKAVIVLTKFSKGFMIFLKRLGGEMAQPNACYVSVRTTAQVSGPHVGKPGVGLGRWFHR